MTVIKPFTIEYEKKVLELFRAFNNPNVSDAQFSEIWLNKWRNENEVPGFMMLDDDVVVGFLGLIYGSRTIKGVEYRTCNQSSWIVKPEYRADSLKLILPILKLKDYILTNLTPSETVQKIISRLGFTQIDNDVFILPSFVFAIKANIECYFDVDSKILTKEESKLYNDHLQYECKFGIVQSGDSHCLFAYKIRKKKGIRFVYILYISNPDLFYSNFNYIRSKIFRHTFSLLIMIDSRLTFGKKISFKYKLSNRLPKYFKSNIENISEIDNLYSEFVLLNI